MGGRRWLMREILGSIGLGLGKWDPNPMTIDEAILLVETRRLSRIKAWEDSGYDYYSDLYQQAQSAWDEALRIYNDLILNPYREQHRTRSRI